VKAKQECGDRPKFKIESAGELSSIEFLAAVAFFATNAQSVSFNEILNDPKDWPPYAAL